MNLYLNFERTLDAADLDALRALVQRRGQREPLQYIVGTVSFCGLELIVNKNVLIPRPETELLAERAWNFLKLISAQQKTPHALDLCAGSGCLAISMAAHVQEAQVCATDLSADALAVCQTNITRHNLGERISLRQGDGFGALSSPSKFDLIVSNPPYIPTSQLDTLEPELRDYEPRAALDGGADGLDFYRRIADQAGPFLKKGARLMVELEEEGASAARHIFEDARWMVEALEPDYNRKPRILIARLAD